MLEKFISALFKIALLLWGLISIFIISAIGAVIFLLFKIRKNFSTKNNPVNNPKRHSKISDVEVTSASPNNSQSNHDNVKTINRKLKTKEGEFSTKE